MALAPLAFLAVFELSLRLFGYGYQTSYFIKSKRPDTSFSNPDFSCRFLGRKLRRDVIPTVLTREKANGETYRIFVFGGSAALGFPYKGFSFARILEAMLNDRYPKTRFEVVNASMTAINSHVVLPIVRDASRFDADLYIVYMGHNEVVGPYGPGSIFQGFTPSLSLIRASIGVHSWRMGQLLSDAPSLVARLFSRRGQSWSGMKMFMQHRVALHDPRLKTVYGNFAANLTDICRIGQDAGVKVIVSTVVSNLMDPPFHSMHRAGLHAEQTRLWDSHVEKASSDAKVRRTEQALEHYQQADQIDDRHAQLHFDMAHCYLALGKIDLARQHFAQARDLDVLRFRADTRINEIVREVAIAQGEAGVFLVDAERAAAESHLAASGIPGSQLLHEHVHLRFEGNHLVAAAMFPQVIRLLPAAIRGQVSQDMAPPGLHRCAQLTLFNEYFRYANAREIAMITAEPPFPAQVARRCQARAKNLEAYLSQKEIDRAIEAHLAGVARKPNDLLTREHLVLLHIYRGQWGKVVAQLDELNRRYPLYWVWHLERNTALKHLDKQGSSRR